jgi:hypothetical protein
LHLVLTVLLVAALAFNGALAGASLDQSLKQLPARRKIGAEAFSAYLRAADLGPGIAFYATLGVGAAVTAIAFALAVWWIGPAAQALRAPAYAAGILSLLHSIVTGFAAPVNFSQLRHPLGAGDEQEIARIIDRFARLQGVRCALQVATFALLLWAMSISLSEPGSLMRPW